MVDFLERTGSYLTVNTYPFFAYAEPDKISLDYNLGNSNATGVRDSGTGLVYHSLLDAQLDATYFAMEKLGTSRSSAQEQNSMVQIFLNAYVSETGWTSVGQLQRGVRRLERARDEAASVANAQAYNNYLIDQPRGVRRHGHPIPPRRRHGCVHLHPLQREPEGRRSGQHRAALRPVLPEPDEGVRVRLPGRCAGELVCGERGRRGRVAAGGAGLRVRPRRRLQRHPAWRTVLRARHQARARLVCVQQLLPAQRRGQGACDFDGAAYIVYHEPAGTCDPNVSWCVANAAVGDARLLEAPSSPAERASSPTPWSPTPRTRSTATTSGRAGAAAGATSPAPPPSSSTHQRLETASSCRTLGFKK